jgi:branched-chain amino acid transport system substrate-binding protein
MRRRLVAVAMTFAFMAAAPVPARRPDPERFRIPVDSMGLKVMLYHMAPTKRGEGTGRPPVLFVHGASFPTLLAAGYRFDSVSWMDDLAVRGFDVWGLDFLGYGGSDRYPEQREHPLAHPPLGRAGTAARQISAAVEFIVRRQRASRVSLVAHSWGTIPAGLYATGHHERVGRLVQFGPVVGRNEAAAAGPHPSHGTVTQEDQRARFYGYVPPGEAPLMAHRHFAAWGPAYMTTDSASSRRVPAGVDVPRGPIADAEDAWSGHLSYDPGKIMAPVLIVRGEWDDVTPDADARWLYDRLTAAPIKRDVKIGRGSHVMHLEASRRQLYREVSAFLGEDDVVETTHADSTARWVHLAGLGALTGPVRSFGIGSWAALRAATDSINQAGGIRLGDGTTGYFRLSYADDGCRPEDAVRILRGIAASDALVAIGPSCSSVAETLYGTLQRRVETRGDTGIQLPVFTDGASQAGLARRSEWAFRNAPDERAMYRSLWAYVRRAYPTLKTIYAGREVDFAHSRSTWEHIIRPEATAAGYTLIGEAGWSVSDSAFGGAADSIAAARSDIVVVSGHVSSTCGVIRALADRGMKPGLLVGLTSASSPETLERCGAAAEGLLVPTSFAPVTPAARAAAAAVRRTGGSADLHSMAAWEIAHALRQVIEAEKIVARPESLAQDRRRLRDGLAALGTMQGLLGAIERTPDRESRKPFVILQARRGEWRVVDQPVLSP